MTKGGQSVKVTAHQGGTHTSTIVSIRKRQDKVTTGIKGLAALSQCLEGSPLAVKESLMTCIEDQTLMPAPAPGLVRLPQKLCGVDTERLGQVRCLSG